MCLRPIVVRDAHDPDLGRLLAVHIETFLKEPAARALRPLVADATKSRDIGTSLEEMLPSLPPTRRTEWLVDALARAWHVTWRPAASDDGAPIALPATERDRILRRLEKVWEHRIQRFDDEPDADEYADAFEEEIERIGTKHDTLALRLVQRRFPDARNPKLTWTFRQLLGKHGVDSPEKLLAFFERHLDVVWSEPEEGAGR